MPIQDQVNAGQDAFLENTQNTHSKTVQASAARLLLQLRADFAEAREHELTEQEHAFLKTSSLANCTSSSGIPAEWDINYPNLRGLYAFIRAAFSHPRFKLEEYQIICKNMSHLAEMRKDHWSTKAYYSGDVLNHLQPSMGEVINLVSHGILNDKAFKVTSQGAVIDRQDRVYLLYQQFLNVKNVCSTGISNDFLFLLNGYKGIFFVEYIDAYVHELACQFVTAELLEEYDLNSVELYQMILNALDLESEAYENWLVSKKEKLEAYLTKKCLDAMLDPEESKVAISKLIGGIISLEIPSDIHPSAMSAIKYLLRDYTIKKDFPLVKEAIGKVGGVLRKMKSLAYVESYGFIEFYRAIEYMHRSQKYQNRNLFALGEEEGSIVNASMVLNDLLRAYFLNIQQQNDIRPESLCVSGELKAANAALNAAIKKYESGSLKEFVESFFGILGNQESDEAYRKICQKMDVHRSQLVLTDDQLDAWVRTNLNHENNEVSITVYEVNRVLLHALWVSPREWTVAYKDALGLLFEWFDNPNESDLCKQAVKNTCFFIVKCIRLLYVIVSAGRLDDIEREPRIGFPQKIYETVNLGENINNLTTLPNALINSGENHFQQYREFYIFIVRQIRKFNFDIDDYTRLLEHWSLPAEERAIVFDEMLQMQSLGDGGFMGRGPITGFLKASDQAVSDDEKNKVMLFLKIHLNEIILWGQCVGILYEGMNDDACWISTRSSEELDVIKKKLLEHTDLGVLFTARSECEAGSNNYDLFTKKLEIMISHGAWITEDDLSSLLIENNLDEAQVMAILSMLSQSPVQTLKFTSPNSALLKTFPGIKAMYGVLIQGRLSKAAPTDDSLGLVYKTFIKSENRDDFFAEIFKSLAQGERPEWSMYQIYNLFSEKEARQGVPSAKTLNPFFEAAQAQGYVFTVIDILSLIGLSGRDASLFRMSYYLRELSGDWLTRIHHYLFNETKTSLDISFQAAFLNLYYSLLHEKKHNDLCRDVFLLLGFHLSETFVISDDDVNKILESHYDDASQSLRLSESEITCFVVHALHVPPLKWTPTFKHAFGWVLQALKAADFRGPLGVPELIDNLNGLWIMAESSCLMIDDRYEFLMIDDRYEILLLNYKNELCYYSEDNFKTIFSTSYIINFLVSSVFDKDQPIAIVCRQLFESIKPVLSRHVRTFRDFINLLRCNWLTEAECDALIALPFTKKELYLQGSWEYYNFYVIEECSHLTEAQKKRIRSIKTRVNEVNGLTTLSLFNQSRQVDTDISCKNETVLVPIKRA